MKHQGLLTLTVTAALALGLSSCGSRKEQAAAEGDATATAAGQLLERLNALKEKGTMLGHHDDPVYGHTWVGDSLRSDILETAGAYPAMMSWDLGGLELGNDSNLDGVPFVRMREEIRRQDRRGGFNTFSWHLYSPVDSTDCWTIGDSLTVQKIINDDKVRETFRSQLAGLARFFNSLTDDEGNRIGVIFRPFHEHTGGWFWWGKNYNTPEEYKALWDMVREEFTAQGVDNVAYAYSPDRFSTEEQYLEYYPGDDMVDILGVDIYLFGGEEGLEDYKATTGNALSIVRRLSEDKGKIPAFTETGSEGIPMTGWWNDDLLPLLKENPVSYVVLWRNAHDKPGHFYVPFAGHPSEEAFKTFCNDSTVLLINNLK